MLIYVGWIHWLLRGHWFAPHVISTDRYGFEEYDGCDICHINDYRTFYHDRHNAGLCPKFQQGYNCHGLAGECGQ
jgi:hypothetical protein